VLQNALNAQLHMIRNNRPISKSINIPSTEAKFYNPINDSANHKNNISSMTLQENDSERIRPTMINIDFMLTDAKLMEDDIL
jgi:hypothetical protein